MDFTTQPYLSLETYRKDGEALRTPVWFVRDGEWLYIRTVAESGKVKRLGCAPRFQIAFCDPLADVTGPRVVATGHEVCCDPVLSARMDQLLDEKYGEIKHPLAARMAT